MCRKLFLILAIFCVITSLAACNNKSAVPTNTSVVSESAILPEQSGTSTATPEESAAPTAPEPTETQSAATATGSAAASATAKSTAGTADSKTEKPAISKPPATSAPATTSPAQLIPTPSTSADPPKPKSGFEKPYDTVVMIDYAKSYGADIGMIWEESLTKTNCSWEAPIHTSAFKTESEMKQAIQAGIDSVKAVQVQHGCQPGKFYFRLYLEPIANNEFLMYFLIG